MGFSHRPVDRPNEDTVMIRITPDSAPGKHISSRWPQSFVVTFCLFFNALMGIANAMATPAQAEREIDHLLSFIERSQCIYIRNGDSHTGTEAAKHIRRKYKHYRDDINTSEDFIRLSATQSALTGKKYSVQCPEQDTINSNYWLQQELESYRKREL